MGLFDWMRRGEPDNVVAAGYASDPVCGMKVDTRSAPGGSSRHGHSVYYFCSMSCRQRFDDDPHRWLGHHQH